MSRMLAIFQLLLGLLGIQIDINDENGQTLHPFHIPRSIFILEKSINGGLRTFSSPYACKTALLHLNYVCALCFLQFLCIS